MIFDDSESFPGLLWVPGDEVHTLFGEARIQSHRTDSSGDGTVSILDHRDRDWFAGLKESSDASILSESAVAKHSTANAEGDIVVTGKRVHHYVLPLFAANYGATSGWTETGAGEGAGGDGTTGLPDEASVDITVNITRPLTANETAAIEHLKETIASITTAIANLSPNAIVTLPNGAQVTGAQLQTIWAKTDFVINDKGHVYSDVTDSQGHVFPGNDTNRGQANPNFGDPVISFNIDIMDAYDDFAGGMNYLVAHELGHLSQAATPYFTNEMTANDISRALLNGAGLSYLDDPNEPSRYDAGAPMYFTVPPPPPPPPSGGSGGGEGGGWGTDIP